MTNDKIIKAKIQNPNLGFWILLVIYLSFVIGVSPIVVFGQSLIPTEPPEFPKDRVWFNSTPLSKSDLQGKVVLFDFWTYSCINCIRTFPYLKSWHKKYGTQGLIMVGIHAPEFFFERDHNNVKQAIERHGITWPVVLDNDNHLWNLFHNRYWPSKYLYGADGKFLESHFGEGAYDEIEKAIQGALKKAGQRSSFHEENERVPLDVEDVHFPEIATPEIYLGHQRLKYAQNSPIRKNVVHRYRAPTRLIPNHFAFDGLWKIEGERAVTAAPGARLILFYKAKKVNIVAASPKGPVNFRLKVDGQAIPKEQTSERSITIDAARLYRLVETKTSQDHILEIIFEKPGVEVYTFTFG